MFNIPGSGTVTTKIVNPPDRDRGWVLHWSLLGSIKLDYADMDPSSLSMDDIGVPSHIDLK